MECPFELPVKISPKCGMFCVLRSREGGHLAELLYRKDADYIVQAINSHEKFKEVARYLWENDGDKDLVNRTIEALKEKP